MSDLYGPPLPPGFSPNAEDSESSESEPSNQAEDKFIGPQCPSDFLKDKKKQGKTRIKYQKDNSRESEVNVIGPSLPPGLSHQNEEESEDSDTDAAFGPMPSHHNNLNDYSDVLANVEKRASDMKRKLDGPAVEEPKRMQREEWMTTPNTSRKNQLGAISRCLTYDPSKVKKSSHKEKHRTSERDEKLSKELQKYNKSKRSKSLLEMHQKKKKKDKDSSKPNERKPFDRDTELNLRFMDRKQIGSVIDKAKLLDSRFAKGQSKYL